MLIVEPSSARFEASESGVLTNEHLLERVSATENRIARLAERLERSLDLVLKQVQNSHYDRTLVTALVDLLAQDGLVDKTRLEQMWNQRCALDVEQSKTTKQQRSVQARAPHKKRSSKGNRK